MKSSVSREARCERCKQDMEKLFMVAKSSLENPDSAEVEWLCSSCVHDKHGRDSGRWKNFVRMSNPLHAAAAAGDAIAFRELWDGPGARALFPHASRSSSTLGAGESGGWASIDLPVHCGGVSGVSPAFEGFTPLFFSVLPPTDTWPPLPPDMDAGEEASKRGCNGDLVRLLLNLGASVLARDHRGWAVDRHCHDPRLEPLLAAARTGEEEEAVAEAEARRGRMLAARRALNRSKDALRQAKLLGRMRRHVATDAAIDAAFSAMARGALSRAGALMVRAVSASWPPPSPAAPPAADIPPPLAAASARRLLEEAEVLLCDQSPDKLHPSGPLRTKTTAAKGDTAAAEEEEPAAGARFLVASLSPQAPDGPELREVAGRAWARLEGLKKLNAARDGAEQEWARAKAAKDAADDINRGRRPSGLPAAYVPERCLSGDERGRAEQTAIFYVASTARQLACQAGEQFEACGGPLGQDACLAVAIGACAAEQALLRRTGLADALESWRDRVLRRLAAQIDTAEAMLQPAITQAAQSVQYLRLTAAEADGLVFWWKAQMQRHRVALGRIVEAETSRRASDALYQAHRLLAELSSHIRCAFHSSGGGGDAGRFVGVRLAACRSLARRGGMLFEQVGIPTDAASCRGILGELDEIEKEHLRRLAAQAFLPSFEAADRRLVTAAVSRQLWAAEEATVLYEGALKVMHFQRLRFPNSVIRLPIGETRARLALSHCLLFQRDAALRAADEAVALAESAPPGGEVRRQQWPRAHAVQALALFMSDRRKEAVAALDRGLDAAFGLPPEAVQAVSSNSDLDAVQHSPVKTEPSRRGSADGGGAARTRLEQQMACLRLLATALEGKDAAL